MISQEKNNIDKYYQKTTRTQHNIPMLMEY